MEQKKTLWIIAAVGVFLLVVLGGAIFIYGPSKKASNSTITTTIPVEKTATPGWTQLPENPNQTTKMPYQTGFATADVGEMVVLSENTKVYGFNTESVDKTQEQIQPPAPVNQTGAQTIDLNALKREYTGEYQPTPSNQNQNVNITVNIPDSYGKQADSYVTVQTPVSVSSEYYMQEVESKTNVSHVQPYEPVRTKAPETKLAVPEVKTPAPVKTNTNTTAPVAKTTATVTTSKTTVTTTVKPVTRFWVQVAAYSNKNTAENARSVLSEKKISSDIYTYQDAKDKLYYRVRVGPFTTKSEAEYWKAKIVEIKDFASAGSYVTSTTD